MGRVKVTVIRMAHFIEYKAHWAGVLVSESMKLGLPRPVMPAESKGEDRIKVSLCDCGLRYNADLN